MIRKVLTERKSLMRPEKCKLKKLFYAFIWNTDIYVSSYRALKLSVQQFMQIYHLQAFTRRED